MPAWRDLFPLRRTAGPAGLAIALLLAGCGGENTSGGSPAADAAASAPTGPGMAAPEAADTPMGGAEPSRSDVVQTAAGDALPKTEVTRRIIYTAEVELVVERLAAGEQALLQLTRQHGGYVAGSEISGTPGEPRNGHWDLRVPVARFDAFMSALSRLGEVQRTHTDSQDVTEEYYDLAARLTNKKREEKRLLQHLDRSTARLQDILAVEREISRVREEIERMEGRLRLLSHRTELTSISVTLHEVKDYVPPRPTTFADRVGRTFTASLGTLREAGKELVLFVVAVVPWLLVFAVIALLGFWLWRPRRRPTPAANTPE